MVAFALNNIIIFKPQRGVVSRLGSTVADGEPVRMHPFFKTIDWNEVACRRLEPPFKPCLVCCCSLILFQTVCVINRLVILG